MCGLNFLCQLWIGVIKYNLFGWRLHAIVLLRTHSKKVIITKSGTVEKAITVILISKFMAYKVIPNWLIHYDLNIVLIT